VAGGTSRSRGARHLLHDVAAPLRGWHEAVTAQLANASRRPRALTPASSGITAPRRQRAIWLVTARARPDAGREGLPHASKAPNMPVERTTGSRSLAAAAHRRRSAEQTRGGSDARRAVATSLGFRCHEVRTSPSVSRREILKISVTCSGAGARLPSRARAASRVAAEGP
jgi:hypothetical protein